jgi:hypothetical protein
MRWLLIALLSTVLYATDLASIEQEPNLEKRSQLAIDYASTALDAARKQYQDGDMAKTEASLSDVGASVDLAYQSLLDTHKEARRDPKVFKRTELATRQLLRRIEGMAESMSFEDRRMAEKVRDRVAAIHDNLLQAIMKKK